MCTWSSSLLQFAIITPASKKALTSRASGCEKAKEIYCNVWAILVNVILQDAPFFVFRVMLITYYELISSMNLFCTAKNTLVIILQIYRLVVEAVEAAAKVGAIPDTGSCWHMYGLGVWSTLRLPIGGA